MQRFATLCCAGTMLFSTPTLSDEYTKGLEDNEKRRLECIESTHDEAFCDKNAAAYKKFLDAMKKSEQCGKDMNTVQIGMRDTAVKTILKSCDKPYINTTVTANGLQEQWVWHNAIYFYFDNHFLTAVQYPTIPGLKPRQ